MVSLDPAQDWAAGGVVLGGQGSGGTMHLEERHVEKYANMEACNVGGYLFNLHI